MRVRLWPFASAHAGYTPKSLSERGRTPFKRKQLLVALARPRAGPVRDRWLGHHGVQALDDVFALADQVVGLVEDVDFDVRVPGVLLVDAGIFSPR